MKKNFTKSNKRDIIKNNDFVFWLMVAINPEDNERKIVFDTITFLLQNDLINKEKLAGGKIKQKR